MGKNNKGVSVGSVRGRNAPASTAPSAAPKVNPFDRFGKTGQASASQRRSASSSASTAADVQGRRQHAAQKSEGQLRDTGYKKRKETILAEYRSRHKTNQFSDRRLGANEDALTREEVRTMRFQEERLVCFVLFSFLLLLFVFPPLLCTCCLPF